MGNARSEAEFHQPIVTRRLPGLLSYSAARVSFRLNPQSPRSWLRNKCQQALMASMLDKVPPIQGCIDGKISLIQVI